MILRVLAQRAKRAHDVLWVQLVWLEPFGHSTWAVWTNENTELARSRFLLWALWRAGCKHTSPR